MKKIKLPIYTEFKKDSLIHLWIDNPLKTWWKARKYFKLPKLKFHVFKNPILNCPYCTTDRIAKLLDINFHDVQWKDKFDSPRHEISPHIWVCFFHKFGFSINFVIEYLDELGNKQSGDTFYWEYLLDYLYYDKTLRYVPTWVRNSKVYYTYDHENKKYRPVEVTIPTHQFSLNKRGLKELRKLIGK